MEGTFCWVVALGTTAWVLFKLFQNRPKRLTARPPELRRLAARWRSVCAVCSGSVLPETMIDWDPETKRVQHADCQASAQLAASVEVQRVLEKIEKATGPVSRRNALVDGLTKFPVGEHRTKLLIEAGRIQARAVLDKADSLKSPAAKRRHLTQAIEDLKKDEVADELQREEFAWLEDALKALD